MNIRPLKVAMLWTTIVYIVCFGGVALVPGIRPWFMHYASHTNANIGDSVTTVGTFFCRTSHLEHGCGFGGMAVDVFIW
jgi:hypothetical protein